MTLSETPPEGLLDWIKAQDLQWRDYFIYRAGWQTDPLTGLRLGLNFLMQKRNGEIVGVVPRGANLDVRRYAITAGGIVRQEDGDTGERLYRRGYRPREDTDSEATLRKWRHLEVMSWCDWDAPEE